MSLSRRTVLLSLPALAACGFDPVFAPGGSAEALRGKILIDAPRDTIGFELVRQLEARLGQPNGPKYSMGARISLEEDALAITPEAEITRFSVLGEVDFQVVDIIDGQQLTAGSVESFTSYSNTGSPVSTRSARRDARTRLMIVLADKIVARLLATEADWAK